MKIKYQFVTETTEVEVSDEWGSVLLELDRQEYNLNHKETRRHCSLEAYDQDHNLVGADDDVLETVIAAFEQEEIKKAISKLSKPQQEIINAVCSCNITPSQYAKIKGISRVAAYKTYNLALRKIKNFVNLG